MSADTDKAAGDDDAREAVNLRKPLVMEAVQAQVERHYRSLVVERIRERGGTIAAAGILLRLAKKFGFCYGVERAIDLAYAARKVFADKNLYILGEIIHNPEVNHQIAALGIRNLIGPERQAEIADLSAQDIVIVPAFGAKVGIMEEIRRKGCHIVDTTCGDVMSVWKRVRQNARDGVTSIIHGKAEHEETKATSSRARVEGQGHYLIVLTLDDTDAVCDYIVRGGDKRAFLDRFRDAHSEGFDPDVHLRQVGVANQTTMLRGETEEVQRRIRAAIVRRDGPERASLSYRHFDTICGATQDRQDALADMLDEPMDALLVVGGYNSSNTSHLAEMGQGRLPTYFVRNAARLRSVSEIQHYDLHRRQEIITRDWLRPGDVTFGVTAGASCPNNLIEEVILKLFALRGVSIEDLMA